MDFITLFNISNPQIEMEDKQHEDINASCAAESLLTPPPQKKARPTVGLKVPRRKHITEDDLEVKKCRINGLYNVV